MLKYCIDYIFFGLPSQVRQLSEVGSGDFNADENEKSRFVTVL